MPVTRKEIAAFEQGVSAPSYAEPKGLGSMMVQAFSTGMETIGVQQANQYRQEASQVLNLGLDYDEQTKRMSSLKGKYTFGLMTNPHAIVPTPSEQEYARKLADNTQRLKEASALEEIAKRIETSKDFAHWEQQRDQIASKFLDGKQSMGYQATLNALNKRAKFDFDADIIANKAALNELSNKMDNNFLDNVLNPGVEDYDAYIKSYVDVVGDRPQNKAYISSRLSNVLERAGSKEVVGAVAQKYKEYLTPQQVDTAIKAAINRESVDTVTGGSLASKVTAEAKGQHILGVPLGVDSRFISNKYDRYNENFLQKNNLGFVAPEVTEGLEGTPPIAQTVAQNLRNDLQTDPFEALQKRGAHVAPSPLSLPAPTGEGIDKYKAQLKQRLEQIDLIKNKQYAIDKETGTRYVTHAHTQAEIQVLDSTYEAADPYTKARMALAEYRTIEEFNATKPIGQKIEPDKALPFKDKDAAKLLNIGLNDHEFTAAFTNWKKMTEKNRTKANDVVNALVDELITVTGQSLYHPGYIGGENNVYDDYEGIAIYNIANSGKSLYDLSIKLTGENRKIIKPDPKLIRVLHNKYSTIIHKTGSTINNVIDKKNITLSLMDINRQQVTKTFKLKDLLESQGKLVDNSIYMPLARLVPDKGSSITKFKIQVATTIDDRNAGIWYDLYSEDNSDSNYILG